MCPWEPGSLILYPILDLNSLNDIPYPTVNCLTTVPFTAAHSDIAHIWQPPCPSPRAAYTITVDSLNGHNIIYKRDTSVKQTIKSYLVPAHLLHLFDSLQDGHLYLINFIELYHQWVLCYFLRSLHSTSQLDRNIKGQMIKDLFNLAGFRIPENLITTSTSRYQVLPNKSKTSNKEVYHQEIIIWTYSMAEAKPLKKWQFWDCCWKFSC